jgi:hypothetical protein
MNSFQIKRFIKKVYPYHEIEVKYYSDKSKAADLAYAVTTECPPKIFLNKSLITKKYHAREGVYLKGGILHELGHIDAAHIGSDAKIELSAHLFAIKKAEEFKMWKIRKGLLYWLWSFGGNRFISKNRQAWRDAYNLFLKDEKLCKKYSKVFRKICLDIKKST